MTQKILFLCPHNAAKSVIATAYFNTAIAKKSLDYVAESAGTDPSPAVSPIVVQMLNREGIDVSNHVPRAVSSEDLQNADRVISMGCAPEELNLSGQAVDLWEDVPTVREEPERAREVIQAHIDHLIQELEAKS
jgi:arsenate reductase (thioredoxin)